MGGDRFLVETRLKLKLKRNPREMKGRTRLDTPAETSRRRDACQIQHCGQKQVSSPDRVGRRISAPTTWRIYMLVQLKMY